MQPEATESFGRFRLIERLGQGGMGSVYLAETPGAAGVVTRCVIKRLLPHLADDHRFVQALIGEARVCARLNHASIVRLQGLGQVDDEYYLEMEYVEGVTLRTLLRACSDRNVAMEPGLACYIAAQIADALGYAHALTDDKGAPLQIVHRDVTPANIMVATSGRVKLLDFGVARVAHSLHPDRTKTGDIKGTLRYMSPEQARGLRVDGRSDQFSLGAVLYECLTGQRLFVAENDLHLIHLICERDAPRVSGARAELDPELDAIVARMLARNPDERYPTSEAVAAALWPVVHRYQADESGLRNFAAEVRSRTRGEPRARLPPSTTVPERSQQQQQQRRRALSRLRPFLGPALLAAALLPIFTWVGLRVHAHYAARAPAGALASSQVRQIAAVLELKDKSAQPDDAWLSTAAAEILGTVLGQSGRLRILAGSDVARMKSEVGIGDTDSLTPEQLARVRRDLDVDLVLLGSYLVTKSAGGPQLRFDLRVQETRQGATVAQLTESGDESAMFGVLVHAAQKLRQQLGDKVFPSDDNRALLATLPASVEAARLYFDGLARIHDNDYVGARDVLEAAVKADRQHALSYAALAQTLSWLGYDDRARDAGGRSMQLAPSLPREQRLWVEARYYTIVKEQAKAVDTYRTLFDFFPDNIDYGLKLAEARIYAEQPAEALAVTQALRKLPSPLSDDPRIDLMSSWSQMLVGNTKEQEADAKAALAKARARGAEQTVANAEQLIALAYYTNGRCREAIPVSEDAKQIFARLGDQRGVVRNLNDVARCLQSQGNHAEALVLFEECVKISEQIGDRAGLALELSNAGATLWRLGRRGEGLERIERSLQVQRESKERRALVIGLTVSARLRLEQGDLAGAQRRAEELLSQAPEGDLKQGLVAKLPLASRIREAAGELGEARQLLDRRAALLRKLGQEGKVPDDEYQDGELLRQAGQLPEARRSIEQAMAAFAAAKDDEAVHAGKLHLAEVAVAEGRLDEAEAATRAALAWFVKTGDPDQPSAAHELLARMALRQGKLAAARAEVDRALATAGSEPSFAQRLRLGFTLAAVEAAEKRGAGGVAAAEKRMQKLIAEARRGSWVELELEGELALLTLQARQATRASAAEMRQATALRDEARRRGLVLLANQAAALAR